MVDEITFLELVNHIVADKSNRGHSPKGKNVRAFAKMVLSLKEPLAAIEKLSRNDDLGCRKVAADALSIIKSKNSLVEIGERLLEDTSWEVREYAAFVMLNEIVGKKTTEWLSAAVRSPSSKIRRGAAIVARELLVTEEYRSDALHALLALVDDDDAYVQDAVSPFSLGDQLLRVDRSLGERTLALLAADKRFRARRCAALALQAAEARPFSPSLMALARSLLQDKESGVAKAALRAVALASKKGSKLLSNLDLQQMAAGDILPEIKGKLLALQR